LYVLGSNGYIWVVLNFKFMKKLLITILLFLKKKLAIASLVFADLLIFSGSGNYFFNEEDNLEGFGVFCILFGFIINFLYWKKTKNFNLILRASLYVIILFILLISLIFIFLGEGLEIVGLVLISILILFIFLINKYTIIFKDKANK